MLWPPLRPPLPLLLLLLLSAAPPRLFVGVSQTSLPQRLSVAQAARLLTNVSVPPRERWVVNATNASVLRFPLPPRCAAAAAPPLSCPVEDESYCDEFLSLDADCSRLLTLQELWYGTTLRGYVRVTELQRYADGSHLRERYESMWRGLHRRYDTDGDGNITLLDWLSMRKQYVHTVASCGQAQADARYSSHGVMPIKPCDTCAEHWVACGRGYGGGWTLVYEAAGPVDLQTTSEREPSLLYTHGWRRIGREGGALVDVPPDDTDDEDHDWRSYVPIGGKLADDSIRHLCNGQYMIVQPGRQPVFCAFANASEYADDRPTLKHCLDRYHAGAQYESFGWAAEDTLTTHGFSPGSGAQGGLLLSLGYTEPGRHGASAPWPHRLDDAYAPTGGCDCMDAWEYGEHSYTDGGCHSPDGDMRPWCLTLGGCGKPAAAKGLSKGTFTYCINRCTGSEGCPVQVWCRDNETAPVQYVAPQYTSQTIVVGSAFEFFLALSGVSVICVVGGAVYLFSKIRLQWLNRLKLPPRIALVMETFHADSSTTRIQMSVSKGDLVHVMQIVSQDWWEVREPQTRETGFVPGRCLLLISREEEHLYQAGVVWSGALQQEQKQRREDIADAEQPKDTAGRLRPEQLNDMDILELKAELRRRGDVHPRGDVRRLRAALERMLRTEDELSVAKQDMLPPCFGELTVTVRSCEDLMPTGGESANPFVVLSMGTDAVVKKRTATHSQTLAPEIGEEFQFTIPDFSEAPENESEVQMRERVSRIAAECVLSVAVWDAPNRILDSPCFLGEVKVDLVEEFGKEWLTQEISRAFKLADPDFVSETEHRERRLKERGSHFQDELELGYIDLAIRFRRKEQAKPWWLGGVEALDGVLDMASAGLDLTTFFQPKQVEEEGECNRTCPMGHDLRYRVEDGLTAAARALLPPCDGVLHVTVHSCSNLLPTDSEDHCSDPFVTVSLPAGLPKLQRTRTIKKTLQPTFDQTLSWKVKAQAVLPPDLVLSLTVFDADWGGLAANFLGEAELDLCKFYRKRWLGGRLSKTLHLRDFGREDAPKLKHDTALDECNKREAMSLRPYGTITLYAEFIPEDETRESAADQPTAQSTAQSSEHVLDQAPPHSTQEQSQEQQQEPQLVAEPSMPLRSTLEEPEPTPLAEVQDEEGTPPPNTQHQKDAHGADSAVATGGGEVPLRYCSECFQALAVGTSLWECADCNFILCSACALKALDWSTLDKDSLTLRLDQAHAAANAQGLDLDDPRVLSTVRTLLARADDVGVVSDALVQVRGQVMDHMEKSKLASLPPNVRMPMLSPAEARRRGLHCPSQNLPVRTEDVAAKLAALQNRLAAAKAERAKAHRGLVLTV